MHGRRLVAVVAAGCFGWLALLSLAPELPPTVSAIVYATGGLICHQLPDRSFHWHGAQLAVCARCTGIYLGTCVTGLLVLVPPARYVHVAAAPARLLSWLVVGVAPMAFTVLAEQAHWWRPSDLVRAATGVAFGAVAGLVVASALAALHYRECLPRVAAARRRPQILT